MNTSFAIDRQLVEDSAVTESKFGGFLSNLARALRGTIGGDLAVDRDKPEKTIKSELLVNFLGGDLTVEGAGIARTVCGASELKLRSTLSRHGLCTWSLVDVASGAELELPVGYWGTIERLGVEKKVLLQNEACDLSSCAGPSLEPVRINLSHNSGVRIEALLSGAEFARLEQHLRKPAGIRSN